MHLFTKKHETYYQCTGASAWAKYWCIQLRQSQAPPLTFTHQGSGLHNSSWRLKPEDSKVGSRTHPRFCAGSTFIYRYQDSRILDSTGPVSNTTTHYVNVWCGVKVRCLYLLDQAVVWMGAAAALNTEYWLETRDHVVLAWVASITAAQLLPSSVSGDTQGPPTTEMLSTRDTTVKVLLKTLNYESEKLGGREASIHHCRIWVIFSYSETEWVSNFCFPPTNFA